MNAPLLGEPLPVELMNTIWADRDGAHDALAEPNGLDDWLQAIGDRLDPPLETPAGPLVGEFRELRDALRTLAAVATDDPRAVAASAGSELRQAVTVANRTCAYAPNWSALVWPTTGRPHRETRSSRTPSGIALSVIADAGVRLFTAPEPALLRACLAPGCVLYFVRDHPRREWCSAGCGNRARVARHYQRHRVGEQQPAG